MKVHTSTDQYFDIFRLNRQQLRQFIGHMRDRGNPRNDTDTFGWELEISIDELRFVIDDVERIDELLSDGRVPNVVKDFEITMSWGRGTDNQTRRVDLHSSYWFRKSPYVSATGIGDDQGWCRQVCRDVVTLLSPMRSRMRWAYRSWIVVAWWIVTLTVPWIPIAKNFYPTTFAAIALTMALLGIFRGRLIPASYLRIGGQGRRRLEFVEWLAMASVLVPIAVFALESC